MSKTVTAEQKAERKAADRKAHIDSILADWPPLTPQQARTIAALLRNDAHSPPSGPTAYELEQRRKVSERADALKNAKKLAESLTACDVCNLQPEVHQYQQAYGAFHEWTPGRAEKLMKGKAKK